MGSPFQSATNKSFAGGNRRAEHRGDGQGPCWKPSCFSLASCSVFPFIWVPSLASILLSERQSRFRGEGWTTHKNSWLWPWGWLSAAWECEAKWLAQRRRSEWAGAGGGALWGLGCAGQNRRRETEFHFSWLCCVILANLLHFPRLFVDP